MPSTEGIPILTCGETDLTAVSALHQGSAKGGSFALFTVRKIHDSSHALYPLTTFVLSKA